MTADDATLVAEVLSGDSGAFATLVHRHFAEAFAVARALTATAEDAEDACQDAFARAYFRLEDCHSPGQFRAWLMQIVRRRSHNLRAYQLLRSAVSLEEAGEQPGASSPSRDLEQSELREQLRGALAQLSQVKQRVVRHHDIDGWNHAQIAESLGISVLMSRRHLSDARGALRQILLALDFEDSDDS